MSGRRNRAKASGLGRPTCHRSGLTLVELLIAVALIALTSAAAYNALAVGLKVWKRHQRQVVEEDVAVFFEKLSHDARNVIHFSTLRFEGFSQKMILPAIVRVPADPRSFYPEGTRIDIPGRVEYFYDAMNHVLYRRQVGYGREFGYQRAKEAVGLVRGVEQVTFRYFYYTDNGEVYKSDARDLLPDRIDVEVVLEDDQGRRTMKKMIHLPVGDRTARPVLRSG